MIPGMVAAALKRRRFNQVVVPAGDGEIKYGTFQGPNGVTSQKITGLGYTPGLLLLFTNNLSSATEGDGSYRIAFGAAIPGGSKWSMAMGGDDTSGTSNTRHIFRSDYALVNCALESDAQSGLINDVVGITDGFKVTWTAASQAYVHYIAFPSTLDIHVGTFDTGTSTGTQDITAPGFEPDVTIFGTTLANTTETIQADARWCFGAGVSSSRRSGGGWYDGDAQNPTVAHGKITNSAVIVRHAGAANDMAIDYEGTVAGGFRIDVTTAPAASTRMGYVCIAGADFSADAGVFTAKASTGTQAYTGVGFEPTAGLWFGRGPTVLDTLQSAMQLNMGAATSAANRGVCGVGSNDNGSGNTSRFQSFADAWAVQGGTSSTTDQDADLDSFDADGWTFDWSDVTTATYGCYLMFRKEP